MTGSSAMRVKKRSGSGEGGRRLQGERRTPNAEAVEELSVCPSASQLHSIEFATKFATKFGTDALGVKFQLSHVWDRQWALGEDGDARVGSVLNQAFGDDRRNIRARRKVTGPDDLLRE